MDLPIPYFNSMSEALTTLFHEKIKISGTRRITGGDINRAYGLSLSDGTQLFMKSNTPDNISFFKTEAAGLTTMASTGAVRTPRLLCYGSDSEENGFSFLLMDFLSPSKPASDYWEVLGEELAAMHQADTAGFVSEGRYGFFCDNYIGSGNQSNVIHANWTEFFRSCRLEPQFRRAGRYFNTAEQRNISHLLDHLDDLLIEPDHPSLLHGDLWSGNVITGNDGRAWLIDPAAYVGHAEADLAMTELFGGFPAAFYDAYKKAAPLQPGYDDRRDLYNLYHLLNHLNLFGTAYLSPVKRILGKYT